MKETDAAKVKKVLKPKEFNDYGIVVKGQHVTIKLNGETTVDGDFEKMAETASSPCKSTPGSRRCGSKFKDIAVQGYHQEEQ